MLRTKIVSLFVGISLAVSAQANTLSSEPAPKQSEELSSISKGFYDGFTIWALIETPVNLMSYLAVGTLIAAKTTYGNTATKGFRPAAVQGLRTAGLFAIYKIAAKSVGAFVNRVFIRHTCRHAIADGQNSIVCGAVGNGAKYVIAGVLYPMLAGGEPTILLDAGLGIYNGIMNEYIPQTRFATNVTAGQITIESSESFIQSTVKGDGLGDTAENVAIGSGVGYFITVAAEHLYVPCAAKLRHYLGDPRVSAEELAESQKLCPFGVSFLGASDSKAEL